MNRIFKILGLIIFILTQSCGLKNQNDKVSNIDHLETDIFENYANDSIRDRIFKIAFNNKSTAPSYIVFIAKDLNTGLTKEICCEAPFLSGGMHRELNVKYDKEGTKYIDSTILANRLKTFEFSNIEALNNISFYEYPEKNIVDQLASKTDLESFHREFGRNDSIKFMHFENDTGFVQESFAHIMFNCGIITSRDCIAGNNIWFGDPRKELIIDEEMDE
ncbi:MAG: hypothetical protein WC069_06625 [Candidatus Shapirobacteria bacterium]